MGNIAEETRWLDATAQAALIRNKEVTAGELAEAAISRIDQLNTLVNAVNIPWFAHGRELAKHIDATSPNTAFAGVPFLLKDLHTMYEGQHISQGNKALKEANYIATSDTTLVARFKKQHLVFLGRTSSPEFGSLPVTEPEAWALHATHGTPTSLPVVLVAVLQQLLPQEWFLLHMPVMVAVPFVFLLLVLVLLV